MALEYRKEIESLRSELREKDKALARAVEERGLIWRAWEALSETLAPIRDCEDRKSDKEFVSHESYGTTYGHLKGLPCRLCASLPAPGPCAKHRAIELVARLTPDAERSRLEKAVVEAAKDVQCACTLRQRLSGHLVDCTAGELSDALEALAAYQSKKGKEQR